MTSLASLLSRAFRCDALLVPVEGSCATEYTFTVEIARLHLHTTLLAFDRVALRLIAVPPTWAQRTRPSIPCFRDVSIVSVWRQSFLILLQLLGHRLARSYHPPARASVHYESPNLHSRSFK